MAQQNPKAESKLMEMEQTTKDKYEKIIWAGMGGKKNTEKAQVQVSPLP